MTKCASDPFEFLVPCPVSTVSEDPQRFQKYQCRKQRPSPKSLISTTKQDYSLRISVPFSCADRNSKQTWVSVLHLWWIACRSSPKRNFLERYFACAFLDGSAALPDLRQEPHNSYFPDPFKCACDVQCIIQDASAVSCEKGAANVIFRAKQLIIWNCGSLLTDFLAKLSLQGSLSAGCLPGQGFVEGQNTSIGVGRRNSPNWSRPSKKFTPFLCTLVTRFEKSLWITLGLLRSFSNLTYLKLI